MFLKLNVRRDQDGGSPDYFRDDRNLTKIQSINMESFRNSNSPKTPPPTPNSHSTRYDPNQPTVDLEYDPRYPTVDQKPGPGKGVSKRNRIENQNHSKEEVTESASKKQKEPINAFESLAEVISEANLKIKKGGTGISWDFEIDGKSSRPKGQVLAYIAQMVNNLIYHGIRGECKHPQTVVAVALVEEGLSADRGNNNNNNSSGSKAPNNNNNNNASPDQTFVIGINANGALRTLAGSCVSCVPEAIGGIPVIVVADESELEKDLSSVALNREKKIKEGKKRFPLPENTTVWSWHSEQKVMRYIKKNFSSKARGSVEALGIAHKNGPCTNRTGNDGLNKEANCCDDYLRRKYDRVKNQKGDSKSAVAAYWYSWSGCNHPSEDYCSEKYLMKNKIEVKPRL